MPVPATDEPAPVDLDAVAEPNEVGNLAIAAGPLTRSPQKDCLALEFIRVSRRISDPVLDNRMFEGVVATIKLWTVVVLLQIPALDHSAILLCRMKVELPLSSVELALDRVLKHSLQFMWIVGVAAFLTELPTDLEELACDGLIQLARDNCFRCHDDSPFGLLSFENASNKASQFFYLLKLYTN